MNLKRALLVLLLALMLLASIIVVIPGQSAQAANGKQVWVYYMGFWGGGMTWDWQADVLTDTPTLGKYDSRDPVVAATQIDQAKAAGINAFLVSWFGVGEQVQTTPSSITCWIVPPSAVSRSARWSMSIIRHSTVIVMS
jgi:hypothetical protein